MSEIFISYKREDEARVIRLVQALQRASLPVHWDRSFAGGENWHKEIQSALDAAKCVIVVWTRESVGTAGDFVRDEARRAKGRGVLVPVKLDKIDPPLGFGEIQAIDLTHWKGSPRDPFFQDLIAAVTAKLEGRPVPPAKGPMKRLTRRLTYSGVTSALLLAGLAFAFNLFRTQERFCGLPILQPGVSDACGALGLGKRPTKSERVAWEAREPGSCAALRNHIEQFPNGAYRDQAAGMLAARRVTSTEVWTATARRLELFEADDNRSARNEAAAQSAALARAQLRAERLCRGFAATASFRLKTATPAAEVWNCTPIDKGVSCGFEGKAVCELEERVVQEHETCAN